MPRGLSRQRAVLSESVISPSLAEALSKRLLDSGYKHLSEKDEWNLVPGGKYALPALSACHARLRALLRLSTTAKRLLTCVCRLCGHSPASREQHFAQKQC